MRNIRIIPSKLLAALLLGTCVISASVSQTLQTRAAVFGEYTAVDYYVVVNTQEGELNFRTGPGAEYPMAYETPFHNGDVLHIAAETLAASGNPWGMTNGGPDGQIIGWVALGPTLKLDNAATVQDAREQAPVAVEAKKNEKTEVDYYVVVNTQEGVLNMRTGPGAEYPMAAEAFHNGDILHIVTEMTASSGNPWGLTAGGADGLTSGWVAIGLTKKIPGATNLAEAQAELARQAAEKAAAEKAAAEKAAAEKAAAEKAAAQRAAAERAAAEKAASETAQSESSTSVQTQTGTAEGTASPAAPSETSDPLGGNTFGAVPVDRYVEVSSNTGTLAVRQGPGTEYAKVTEERFVNGDIIHITKEAVASNGRKWGYTSISGKEGWVALSLTTNSGKAQTASELAADQVGDNSGKLPAPADTATKTASTAADAATKTASTAADAATKAASAATDAATKAATKAASTAASAATDAASKAASAATDAAAAVTSAATDAAATVTSAASAAKTAVTSAAAGADNKTTDNADTQTEETEDKTQTGAASLVTATETEVSQAAPKETDTEPASAVSQDSTTVTGEDEAKTPSSMTQSADSEEQAGTEDTSEDAVIPGIDESGEDQDYVPSKAASEEQEELSREAAKASGFGTGAAIAIGAGALGTIFGIYYSNVRAARKRRREKQLSEREGRRS